jgi:integral membrane protein (TIGR01906 family)
VPVISWRGLVGYQESAAVNLRIAVLPEGRDPDDVIRQDQELWASLIEEARPVLDQGGEPVPLFNIRETAHMADVRDLVQVLFAVQALALGGLVALAVVMLVLWPPRALAAAALYGSVLTAGILALASLVSLSGFDAAWSQFHVIAFANDFWELDPDTDHLIQMFPEAFWFDITMLIGAVTMAEAVLISAASVGYLLISRPKEEPRVQHDPRPALPRPPLEERSRHIPPPNPKHYLR